MHSVGDITQRSKIDDYTDVRNEISLLTVYGNVGFYTHCKVVQAVLIDKNGSALNYFTLIEFDQELNNCCLAKYLTAKPLKINKGYKLAISQYVISIEDFRKIYLNAIKNQKWNYIDTQINSEVQLDEVFHTGKKYIPETDPTGGQYNLVVPLERSLYGSNYMGNYYVCELYSTKEKLSSILSKEDYINIQKKFRECGLSYNLCELNDRVGNIVCKFNVEIIQPKPKRLGAENGISYELILSTKIKQDNNFLLHILREHDGMIYENRIELLAFNEEGKYTYEIEPNQCKNTVIVTNLKNNLIYFMDIRDYSIYSNYSSQINLPYRIGSTRGRRTVFLNGKSVDLPLSGFSMLGEITMFHEMNKAGIRQQIWKDKFFSEQKYFKVYNRSEHTNAIEDLRSIINNNYLLWDLEEIWLIDPYLLPNDILETVIYCKKKDIKIKCLTDLRNTMNNEKICKLLEKGTECNNTEFEKMKVGCYNELKKALPDDTDLRLEYRTIYEDYANKFHDRYLIMKYELNKTRVWSLGTSVNSLGKSHHIVQIVEAPELIADIFNSIWREVNVEECIIYKTNNIE